MLDLGWSEMAMIALLALVVIGPRDLPKVMRTVGRYVRQARGMMRDFQTNLEKMVEEEGLEDVKDTAKRARTFDSNKEIEDLVDPDKSVRSTAADVEQTARSAEAGSPGVTSGETMTDASGKSDASTSGNGAERPAGTGEADSGDQQPPRAEPPRGE